MPYGLPSIGEEPWGQKVNDSMNAVKTTADAAQVDGDQALLDAAAAMSTALARPSSVAGRTGDVVLTKADVGLANVDNTSDANKPVSTAQQTALNLKADVSSVKFLLTGNYPGPLSTGDVIEGGLPIPSTITLDRVFVTTEVEPRGTNLVISVIKRVRSTGTETVLGTLTVTANTSKRASLTGLATAFAQDDRLFLRITQIGSTSPGHALTFTLADTNTTFPAAIPASAAPTLLTAVQSGDNVNVTWTAPATGIYHSVDVYRDGSFLARVLKGTNSFLDIAVAAADHLYELRASNNDATSSTASVSYAASSTISVLADIGSGIANTTSTTCVITVTQAVAINNNVVACLGASVAVGGGAQTWTVTDSRGNTYATNVHTYLDTHTQQTAIALARVTTALQVGDTITFTGNLSPVRIAARAYSIQGLVSTGTFDASQTNLSTVATKNLTTTTTAPLTQAVEIAFVAFSTLSTAPPVTAGAGWNIGTGVSTTAGTNDRHLTTMWRTVNSTVALTGTATTTVSSQFAGSIATYKGAV